jgi:hypothetical protein
MNTSANTSAFRSECKFDGALLQIVPLDCTNISPSSNISPSIWRNNNNMASHQNTSTMSNIPRNTAAATDATGTYNPRKNGDNPRKNGDNTSNSCILGSAGSSSMKAEASPGPTLQATLQPTSKNPEGADV